MKEIIVYDLSIAWKTTAIDEIMYWCIIQTPNLWPFFILFWICEIIKNKSKTNTKL